MAWIVVPAGASLRLRGGRESHARGTVHEARRRERVRPRELAESDVYCSSWRQAWLVPPPRTPIRSGQFMGVHIRIVSPHRFERGTRSLALSPEHRAL